MAPKKKSTKKKAAKKKASPKPKKAAKKKAAKKVKEASKPKKSPRAKTISAKKVAGKKKALRKAKPISFDVPKGPSIAPAVEVKPITVDVVFKLGLGQATLKHFSAGKLVKTERILRTDSVNFPDVKEGDGISITGASAGSSDISTDRVTEPSTDPSNPFHSEGSIAVSLNILD